MTSQVFVTRERVLRGFTAEGAGPFKLAHDSGVLPELVGDGRLLPYRIVASEEFPFVEPSTMVLEADKLGFVSVPCEWSFTMLKDAALLTLDINIRLLEFGFLLKDASAFNVTFDGSRPVFFDHGSIEAIGEAGIWAAYGQFIDHFMSPLFLEAYLDVPFQPRLRGSVTGISVGEMNSLLRGNARRRKGVTTHVVLRNRLDRGAASYDSERRSRVAQMQLPRSSIIKTMQKVRRLIDGLSSSVAGVWSDYSDSPPYDTDEYDAKLHFIKRTAEHVGGGTLIDVGANSGVFSTAVRDRFTRVLAIDVDSGAVDRLYQRFRGEASSAIIPLVVDLTMPTPATGWINAERPAFLERASGDLGLWLAVLHHLTITGGIPLSHSLDLAARLTRFAVIEFVAPDDPMVKLIGATTSSGAVPYDRATFDRELAKRFRVLESIDVKSTRRLHLVESLKF